MEYCFRLRRFAEVPDLYIHASLTFYYFLKHLFFPLPSLFIVSIYPPLNLLEPR